MASPNPRPHTRAAELAILAVSLLLLVGGSCDPSVHTDPPQGPANFELRYGETPTWSRTFVPGPTLAFGANDIFPASGYPMDTAPFPITASLQTPDGEVQRPLEAQLFARSPEDVPMLLADVTDRDKFLGEIITPAMAAGGANGGQATWPDSVVMPYPLFDGQTTANLVELRDQWWARAEEHGLAGDDLAAAKETGSETRRRARITLAPST